MTLSRNKKRIREQTKEQKRQHVLCMRIHTKNRSEERLGFILNRADRKEIIDNIRRFAIVEGNPDLAHIRYGLWKEQEILFVFDGCAWEIRTILPLDHRLIEEARKIYELRKHNKNLPSRCRPRSVGTVEPEEQK